MRKVVNCLSCIVLIFVMVSLFGCGTDERYFRDEYGNKRLDNDEVLIESTVVNSTAYYFYKDNIGDGGSSHVLKKSLLRADGKRIRKDEKSYLIIGIYGRGYNFETFFNASLVDGSDIYFGNDVATFDEAICENINLIDSETKERCKYQSYSKLSLDMSKKNNERLKIDGGIVQFLVAIIPFTPLKEGLLNINLEITRLSSGYTDDHDYTYHKNHQIIIGDDDNTEKIKINDFKVRFISDLDCPDGVINEQKLKNNARFISGVENYMVIDIDYEATKNNDGNDIVDIYVCTSDAQFLHSTIHDVPSGDVEEKTIGDIRYMRVSLKVPKIKRENKNVRLIFKLFLEDDAITDLQILLDSNVLKTSNNIQSLKAPSYISLTGIPLYSLGIITSSIS